MSDPETSATAEKRAGPAVLETQSEGFAKLEQSMKEATRGLTLQRKLYYTLLSAGVFAATYRLPQPYATLAFAALVLLLMWDRLKPPAEPLIVATALALALTLLPPTRKQ